MLCKLSVNINKIATLRNARGGNVPDVIKVAADIEHFGAEGITVHPRPDERHIRRDDVFNLKKIVTTEFNIEGYPSESFLQLVEAVKPQQVTLVPDPPDVLTSNAGWDAVKHQSFLRDTVARLRQNGMRVSLFMDTELKQIEAAATTGSHRIELYTERYAAHFASGDKNAVLDFAAAGRYAHELNLGVNAGHDLSLDNIRFLLENVPQIIEVSIGHALISEALYLGLQNTVQMYKHQIKLARNME
ncbi:MAG: pyridoxine 5'-phosphate synthase [Bacteroidetes bacterium]|jgi:pyridoxine 5-phosphate synthase|nr:pyridoxine 5'-phosphate synthase [Bacteroidota bacterium]